MSRKLFNLRLAIRHSFSIKKIHILYMRGQEKGIVTSRFAFWSKNHVITPVKILRKEEVKGILYKGGMVYSNFQTEQQ